MLPPFLKGVQQKILCQCLPHHPPCFQNVPRIMALAGACTPLLHASFLILVFPAFTRTHIQIHEVQGGGFCGWLSAGGNILLSCDFAASFNKHIIALQEFLPPFDPIHQHPLTHPHPLTLTPVLPASSCHLQLHPQLKITSFISECQPCPNR